MKVISVHDLELYMRCPRAYKFKVVDESISQQKPLSLCKSIATKRVIFWIHQNKFKVTKEDIEQQCDLLWAQELDDPRVDKQELEEIVVSEKRATKKSKGKAAVTKREKILENITTWCLRYSEAEKNTEVLHFNIPYECQIGDVIFTGNIDLVRKRNDVIEIVKLRTSSQPPNQAFLIRDISLTLASYATWKGNFFIGENGSPLQVSVAQIPQAFYYHLPFLETYKRNVKKGKKGDSKGNPLIESTRSEQRLLDFEYEVLQIVAGIEMNYFPMRIIQPCGCCLCFFRHKCESFTQPQIEAIVQELAMKLEELQELESQRKDGESINDAIQRVENLSPPVEVSQEVVPDEEGFVDSDIVIPRFKINQPTTRIEDAQSGHFRNVLTGEEFVELENVIFLKRANGRILFKKDDYTGSRECWSYDGVEPSSHVLEKTGQKPKCERCVTSMANKKIVHCHFAIWKDEPPECKEVISFLGIDQNGLPFWICFHGSAIPIVKGFLGTMYLKKKQGIAQGKNICLRDFKIAIGLNLKVSAKGKYYVPVFKSHTYIEDENERKGLSALFSQLSSKTMEETITIEETLNIQLRHTNKSREKISLFFPFYFNDSYSEYYY